MAEIPVRDADGNEYMMEVPDEQHPAAQRISKRETERLARENAFLKAGINPSEGRLSYFAAGYTGDLDPAKIREAAIRDGFVAAPDAAPAADPTATPPVDPSNPEDAAALAASKVISSVSVGAGPDTRSEQIQMAEAFQAGGTPALTDYLRGRGFTIQNDSQQ